MPLKLQNERHHWWPETVSKFWANGDGLVHRLTPDGKTLSSQPKSFGVIKNDNTIKMAAQPTVWDESFESTFNAADSEFAWLIEWLQTLTSPIPAIEPVASRDAFAARITPFTLEEKRHAQLAECLASLIIRSPGFRNRVRLQTEEMRRRMGFPDPTAEQKLIGMNVRGGQRMLSDAMARGGKFAVLRSGLREFIFGDGFLHNIHSVANAPMTPRCLIPLTPEIAIFYTLPVQYSSYPKAFVMNLVPDEVGFINRAVQIYSGRYLFYRNEKPDLALEFTGGKHTSYQFDQAPWPAHLEDAMAHASFGPQSQYIPANATP
jgi:hypothetical protein